MLCEVQDITGVSGCGGARTGADRYPKQSRSQILSTWPCLGGTLREAKRMFSLKWSNDIVADLPMVAETGGALAALVCLVLVLGVAGNCHWQSPSPPPQRPVLAQRNNSPRTLAYSPPPGRT